MPYMRNWFKPGRSTQLAITCNCLQAFFLFGYDQGVLGGLISNPDFLDTVNHPESTFLGFIVSSYNLGCIIGCLLNFMFGGRFGRRQAIWAAMLAISVGAVLQTSTHGVPQLIVGRVITGIGVGIDTSTVPIYQSELCKAEVRGRLVTSEVLFTGLGVTIAYFFDFGMNFVDGEVAWRVPIAVQIIPAIIVSIILIGLPETPRWLIQQGRDDEAVEVMCKVFNAPPDDSYIQSEKSSILEALEIENADPFRWSKVFRKDAVRTGWRVFLACLVLTMNQWAGINVVVFYIATVLEVNVGLSRNIALVTGGCINLAFVVGSLVPALGLDRIGRRLPMMAGSLGMGISMMMISILLSFRGTRIDKATSSASIAFFVTFMLCFGASLNAIPWCYSAEILPLKARAKGTALAVLVNWLFVFTIVMVTPVMIQNIGWRTYLVFMSCNFVFIPAIYYLLPETKGLVLEDIDHLFMDESALPIHNSAGSSGSQDSQSGEKHRVESNGEVDVRHVN